MGFQKFSRGFSFYCALEKTSIILNAKHSWISLQVFAIELVTFAVDFVPLAVVFGAFAVVLQ